MTATGNAGCLCGGIRLQIDGAPATVLQCHCADCQKSTGGGAVLLAMYTRDAVKTLAGELAGFSVVGGSGHDVRRCFCPDCGTPVYSELGKFPDLLAVKAGIWDDDPGFLPQAAIWTGSAPDWHHIPEGIPNSPGASG